MSKVRSMSPRSEVSDAENHQWHASDEEEEEEEEAREVEDEHLREEARGRDRHKSHHHHHHHNHKSRSRSASKHSPRKHSKGSKNRSSSSKHRPHHDKYHHSSSSSRKKVTQNDSPEPLSFSQKSQSSPLKGKAKEKAFLKNMNVPESEEEDDEGEKNDSQDNNSLLNHSLQSESEVEVNRASTSKSIKKKGKDTKGKKPQKKKRKTGTHGWSKMYHSKQVKHVKKQESSSSSPPSSSEEELEILGEYIPEKIVDGGIRKRADGTKYHMFKVRWKGYKPKDDTWEPEEHLKDRKDLIEEYMTKIGKNKKTGAAKSKVAKPKKSKLPPLDMVNSEEEEEDEEVVQERNMVREEEEAFSGNEQGGRRGASLNNVTPSAHDSNSGSEQEEDEDEAVKRFADEHLRGKSWQKHLIEVKAIRTRNGEDEAHVVFDNGDEGWCPSDPIQERAPNVLIAYMRENMKKQK